MKLIKILIRNITNRFVPDTRCKNGHPGPSISSLGIDDCLKPVGVLDVLEIMERLVFLDHRVDVDR